LGVAAVSLALTACQRPAETPTATTASTDTTTSSAPPVNTAAPGSTTTATAAPGASDSSPGAMVAGNPPAAITPAPVAPSLAPLSAFDKSFATKALEGGLFEVEVGKLARDQASDPAVKAFAQKLVEDHSAANDKLRQIATSHDFGLPATLPADKQKELDRLAKLSGAAFDKEFVQLAGLKDHKADIALFEKASREASSDDLREFAKAALPTLQQHLSSAGKLPVHGKHG
jgi:putative membrane protein